jgi:hypothetical protein
MEQSPILDRVCSVVVKISWLQIQRSGFGSRLYHILWEVLSLERCSLSLMSTIEELLGRNSSGSDLERREYGRRDPEFSLDLEF